MAAPKKVDYDRIEPHWRAGIKSPQQIAEDYTQETGISVSRAAIIKHFAKLGIPRDLSAKIQAKADSMVAEALVTGKVSTATTKRDIEVIDTNATVQANVRVSQQKKIDTSIELVDLLTAQLIDVAGQREDFEAVIEEMTDDDKSDKRRSMLMRAISLPTHASTAANLAASLKTLVTLQREAYGIKVDQANPNDDGANPARGTVFKIVRAGNV